jgi:arylsulfatase A-like enzyme
VYRRGRISGEEQGKLRRAYEGKLEALQGVDDLVEELIDTLERTNQLENLLGERRHDAKGKPYEGSIRMPLLIRGPGVPVRRERSWSPMWTWRRT